MFVPPSESQLIALTSANSAYIPILKFAISQSIGADDKEDIWSVGGDLVYLDAAEQIEFSSSSELDTMQVVVSGVDADYDMISETVTLNGLTPVLTTQLFLRVFRAEIADDSTDVNAGDIDGKASGNTQVSIRATVGKSEMSHLTIPAGYVGLLQTGFLSTVGNDGAEVRIERSVNGGAFKSGAVINVNEPIQFDISSQPAVYKEKTDIKVTATATNNNVIVTANYAIMLVKWDIPT